MRCGSKNCIVNSGKVGCNSYLRHCPTGAVSMINVDPGDPPSLKIRIIDTARCIGCGACKHLCPAGPSSAIYVDGHESHQMI